MCKVLEDMRNEAERNGVRKAEEHTTVNHIKDIMDSFGVTLEKAMETLKIPTSQWDMYARLVGKKHYDAGLLIGFAITIT